MAQEYMNELRLEAGPARDKYVRGDLLFARLEFSDTEMTVSIGPDSPASIRSVSELWSHTVYELENLAMGLRVVALGKLPKKYSVRSRDMLIGPFVHLWPELGFWLGHPGIGGEGAGIRLHCETRRLPLGRRNVINLEATFEGRAERATFEVDEVLAFAEELYEQAKSLAPRFISYGDLDLSESPSSPEESADGSGQPQEDAPQRP